MPVDQVGLICCLSSRRSLDPMGSLGSEGITDPKNRTRIVDSVGEMGLIVRIRFYRLLTVGLTGGIYARLNGMSSVGT